MKLLFVVNPRSGRPRSIAEILSLLRGFLSERALDADMVMTEGPGHATEIARDAVSAGCLRIVAVGGDGTVNEVAQALIHTPAALGLVPCGSGNGLALHLGLPRFLADALELATGTSGRIAELDTGTANGLPFVNVMGIAYPGGAGAACGELWGAESGGRAAAAGTGRLGTGGRGTAD